MVERDQNQGAAVPRTPTPPVLSPQGGEEDQDGPAVAGPAPDNEEMIVPGNNRRMQKRRRERRKLFGKYRKARFLEDFACTANVAASAAAAGVTAGCVFTHRRTDPEFARDYWAALEMAVGKLAALRVQREIERAEAVNGGTCARNGDSFARNGDTCRQVSPKLDGPPDERQIADLVKLMAMIRDLCRNLSGPAAGSAQTPGRPQHAPLDEVCSALAKRLKAFPPAQPGERAALPAPADEVGEEAPPPSCGRSPSPANAGED